MYEDIQKSPSHKRDGLYSCQGRLGVGCVCSVSSLGTYLLQVPWLEARVLALLPFGFLSSSPSC